MNKHSRAIDDHRLRQSLHDCRTLSRHLFAVAIRRSRISLTSTALHSIVLTAHGTSSDRSHSIGPKSQGTSSDCGYSVSPAPRGTRASLCLLQKHPLLSPTAPPSRRILLPSSRSGRIMDFRVSLNVSQIVSSRDEGTVSRIIRNLAVLTPTPTTSTTGIALCSSDCHLYVFHDLFDSLAESGTYSRVSSDSSRYGNGEVALFCFKRVAFCHRVTLRDSLGRSWHSAFCMYLALTQSFDQQLQNLINQSTP